MKNHAVTWLFHDPIPRYNNQWRNVTQQHAFLAALLIYLEDESLITFEAFQGLLGGKMPYRSSARTALLGVALHFYADVLF